MPPSTLDADAEASETAASPDSRESTQFDAPDRWRDRLPSPTVFAVFGFLGLPSLVSPALAWTEPFLVCYLFGLWPLASALLPSPGRGSNPTAWVEMGTDSRVGPLVSLGLIQLNPFVQLTALAQIAGVAPVTLRHRFDLPDVRGYEQAVEYRLPVAGEWTVVAGGPTRRHSHSWSILTQRYAYDLVVTDADGATHEGDGTTLSDFYCFGEPVRAPAGGEVVATNDGHRDHHRIGWFDPRQRDIFGNYVVIRHAEGEYSTLAHLKRGSVAVSEGERVAAGDRVGRCGNSGNSTEPHLHVHVADRASLVFGMGLPVQFAAVRVRDAGGEVDESDRTYLRAGQRVTALEGSPGARRRDAAER